MVNLIRKIFQQDSKADLSFEYEILFHTMTEGVYTINLDGKTTVSNRAAREMLGYSEDEFLGKNVHQLIHHTYPDGRPYPVEVCPLYAAFRDGIYHRGQDEVFWRKDGSCFPVEYVSSPLRKEGQVVGALVTFKDISELKLAQSKLLEERQELLSVLNQAPSVVAKYDRNLMNLYTNEAHAFYFSKTPQQMLGQHMSFAVGPERFKNFIPIMERVLKGESLEFERTIPVANGETRHTYFHILPSWNGTEVDGLYLYITDISELKKLQDERKSIEAKLISSSKMSALGEMASGIAHEINNPLAIILGKTEVIHRQLKENRYDTNKLLLDLEKIASTSSRIARIVKGLLAFSRNSDDLPVERVSINDLIHETLELCQAKFTSEKVVIQLQLESAVEAECRSVQISQVLMNLLSNAFDAISGQTEKWIRIKLRQELDEFSIEVVDSGKGIPKEVADKIMHPFYTTKEVGKGTGLGLSIALGIIQEHKGQFYYDPTSPQTRFVIEMPLKQT